MITFGDILIYAVAFFGIYTATFFTLTMLEGTREVKRKKETDWRPEVCVIVPCYNEENTVEKTVDSLLNLNYPREKLDLIVVDDGSTDNTYEVAKKYEEKGVRVFQKENGGKHTALNLGLEKTDAEIVGALDADSHVDPDALKRMIPYFEEDDVAAVTPALKIDKPDTWLQMVQMIEYLIGIFLRKVFAMLGSNHVTPGPFTLFKKSFFEEHGPYREAYLTEDIEMALRIEKYNYQIENAPNAYVYTIGPPTFKGLLNQRRRWYYGFIQNTLDYKELFSREHGNLGLFVLPSAFISVLLVILTLLYTGFKLTTKAWERFQYMQAINWDFMEILEFNFDPFFLNFNDTVMLGFLVMAISIALILLAKNVAGENEQIKYHYIVYVLIYWLLFGFWWIVAFWNKLLNKENYWNHKSAD